MGVVRTPRAVLREFGLNLPDDVTVRVHDSTAEMRYIVLPKRPEGAEGSLGNLLTDEQKGQWERLAALPPVGDAPAPEENGDDFRVAPPTKPDEEEGIDFEFQWIGRKTCEELNNNNCGSNFKGDPISRIRAPIPQFEA